MRIPKKKITRPASRKLSQDQQRALDLVQTEYMRLTHAVDDVKRATITSQMALTAQILQCAYTLIDCYVVKEK